MNCLEGLRRLTINDEQFTEACCTCTGSIELDPKTLSLVRIGALVAVGGAVPSCGAEADAAVSAGATAAEIVDVLLGVVTLVGRRGANLPHVLCTPVNPAIVVTLIATRSAGQTSGPGSTHPRMDRHDGNSLAAHTRL